MFIDFHCHLSHAQFSKGIHHIVERMTEKNAIALNTGYAMQGNEKVLAQSAEYPGRLHAAIGLSPHDTPNADLGKELEFIETHASEIRAIGEIGLDFHYFKKPEEQAAQEKAFHAQLELAEQLHKPVVVHSRDAEEKVIEILSSYKTPGVLHFFLLPKLLTKAVDAGLYVSVPTLKTKEQKKVFRNVPLERLFLETDSPYGLNNGQRNEPANVVASYERLAELRKMPLKEVAVIILENYKRITGNRK